MGARAHHIVSMKITAQLTESSQALMPRNKYNRRPEERAEGARLEGWKRAPVVVAILRDGRARERATSSG
jgi:hypothetical protein